MDSREETSLPFLDRLKQGDREAQALLVECYSALVRAELRQRLHNADDVDEVAQETFLQVWQLAQTFERKHKGSFRALIRKVARARAIDRARAVERRRLPQGSGDSELLRQLHEYPDEINQLAEQETEEHHRYWTEQLTQKCRELLGSPGYEVFLAVERDGQDRKEVARQHDLSMGAVYLICHRANKTLDEFRARWRELMEL